MGFEPKNIQYVVYRDKTVYIYNYIKQINIYVHVYLGTT